MRERECKILPGIIQSVLKLLELCEGEGATKCSVFFFSLFLFFACAGDETIRHPGQRIDSRVTL